MEEAETLCDRILIMNQGRAVAEGSPENLIDTHVGREVVEFEVGANEIEYYVGKIQGKFHYQVMRNKLKLFLRGQQNTRDVVSEIPSQSVTMRRASLNDVFLKISGHELHD
jgi:lipooligosaccharide transport system ATP-binding protein